MDKLFKKNETNKGFTLIEILVVIGIIAILAAIVLIAINPARQFAQANNTQRNSNVNAILNAVGQWMVDNNGEVPPGIPEGDPEVDADYGVIDNDLCSALVPTYLPAMPTDPLSDNDGEGVTDCSTLTAEADIEYFVVEDEDPNTNRITVWAQEAELGEDIRVTR